MNNTTGSVSPLNARNFPLHGIRLIEASAGTGKTYTIANLYLRLVLGHGETHKQGEASGHSRALGVDQILVVTFTEAATGELRDRIRARIHDTRMAFIEGKSDDPFIQDLINDLDRHPERIELLLAAERQMDEAAIFTIHGFCQRMLKQHAFESGTLFSSELVSDENMLLEISAADFWRRTLYPLDKPLIALARKLWPSPGKLLAAVRPWLNKPNLQVNASTLPDSITSFYKHYIEPALAVKKLWLENMEDIHKQLKAAGLKGNSKPVTRLEKMEAFVRGSELVPSLNDKSTESWEIYGTASLKKALTKSGTLPDHPVFAKIDELLNNPATVKEAFKGLVLNNALISIQQQRAQLKAARHVFSFDDLLNNLATALENDPDRLLAEAILKQFPVAMIDEFQDTDPLQYTIFKTIYIDSQNKNGHSQDTKAGLFMIGDPKQAIYAFRGADIFTYMAAREQVNAHYTLDTNWRSSSVMIAAVNRIFQQAKAPFIYEDDIPFHPVAASEKGQHKSLLINGQPLPAGQLWFMDRDDVVGNTEYQDTMSLATATEINRLLTLANHNNCLIMEDGHSRPLQAGDIAVLVRKKAEGQRIRESLAQQGIASVYMSNSDSVFACQEAVDIQRLLLACLMPTDERALRAALATPLLALDAASLDRLNHDEQVWEHTVEEFTGYQQLWMERGVLPMLRRLIHQRKVAENLLADELGERRLTDLLHLGELLAAAALEQESQHGLLRWFTEAIESPNKDAAEQQLHLESERNLVKIVTIHKSKGLEYNVVFLPFPCLWQKERQPLYHDEKSRQAILDLSSPDQAREYAEKERLAEDLRLLYVALTRSVHTCYIGLAPVKAGGRNNPTDLHRSALGRLLANGQEIEASDLGTILEQLTEGNPAFAISTPPATPLPRYQPSGDQQPNLQARAFTGHIEKDWWVTSYSALSKHATAHSHPEITVLPSETVDPDASQEAAGHDMEVYLEPQSSQAAPLSQGDKLNLFNFPKGARPGTFLHTLFETVDFSETDKDKLDTQVQEMLLKEGFEEHWSPVLVTMLENCLQSSLDGINMKLADIPEHHRKVEMEFFLPIHQLQASALNQLMTQHDPLSAQACKLDFQQVKGMLKGFIDLTFEYQGKWYVLDYKSNWLGDCTDDYSQTHMAQAMIDHRYDLQYQLYSLALHRLLKQRLPDYHYDNHFGGVFYLFLRGVRTDDPERHGIYQHRPHKQFIEKLDALFSGTLDQQFAGVQACLSF
ncbi:exodeoxyribonuclease V subunit beta [Endozoicomonas sp. Mp262]|uniref:exodeoxyribonuclease V subunit beta n=1 Tax=Endozoicomonas sp. Mp262 TaxID=2919499 RepID=UPI0021D8D9B9